MGNEEEEEGHIRKRRILSVLGNGPSDAPVTGLQPIPDEVLLPNYEGGEWLGKGKPNDWRELSLTVSFLSCPKTNQFAVVRRW